MNVENHHAGHGRGENRACRLASVGTALIPFAVLGGFFLLAFLFSISAYYLTHGPFPDGACELATHFFTGFCFMIGMFMALCVTLVCGVAVFIIVTIRNMTSR